MLTTWAPGEFGPRQLADNSRTVKSNFRYKLSCSMNGKRAWHQDMNMPGTGGWPTLPLVTRALVGKRAPDWPDTGMLTPDGNRSKVSWWLWAPRAICLRLFEHFIRF